MTAFSSPGRRRRPDLQRLKDHADFLTVYVREAHPTDEWQ